MASAVASQLPSPRPARAVVGVARDADALDEVREQLGGTFTAVTADAADPVVAELIDAYQPRTLVLNAGAAPLARPVHRHTWQTFSRNWEVDVQHAFHWTREALLHPLDPGSTVIAVSSRAALRGSPISGGYAGAKATIRFLTAYAAEESRREGLGIRFISVLPDLTPAHPAGPGRGRRVRGAGGVDVATFLNNRGPALTPDQAGEEIIKLIIGSSHQTEGNNTNNDWWAFEHSQRREQQLLKEGKDPARLLQRPGLRFLQPL